jgi:hypothetical protein
VPQLWGDRSDRSPHPWMEDRGAGKSLSRLGFIFFGGGAQGPQQFAQPWPPPRALSWASESPLPAPPWGFGCGAESVVPGSPHPPGSELVHPKFSLPSGRLWLDKLPSPRLSWKGEGLSPPYTHPSVKRRRGDPQSLQSAQRSKGELDREQGRGCCALHPGSLWHPKLIPQSESRSCGPDATGQ